MVGIQIYPHPNLLHKKWTQKYLQIGIFISCSPRLNTWLPKTAQKVKFPFSNVAYIATVYKNWDSRHIEYRQIVPNICLGLFFYDFHKKCI
jgi:hypothetical protein